MKFNTGFKLIDTGSKQIIAGFGTSYGSKEKLNTLLSKAMVHFVIAEVNQVHGSELVVFRENLIEEKEACNADGMITDLSGIALVIRTADCFPILLWDKSYGVIAALHSGREGTRLNIANKAVNQMVNLGVSFSNIQAAIGPGISADKYQVDDITWQNFVQTTEIEQKYRYLDIGRVIYRQLLNSGIKENNISYQKVCTFSQENYHSYRRNKTLNRQYSFIVIK